MLKYFDPHEYIGRLSYFKSAFIRTILLIAAIFLVSLLFPYISPYDTNLPEPFSTEHFGKDTDAYMIAIRDSGLLPSILQQTCNGFLAFVFFAPITIRRASDINMDLRWIVPKFLLMFVPAQVSFTPGALGILMLLFIYTFVIEIILLFKPGQAFKEWARSRNSLR